MALISLISKAWGGEKKIGFGGDEIHSSAAC